MNQDLGLLGADGTILEGDLVVLQQLEAVGLGPSAADGAAVHRVGEAGEVHRQAFSELALRSLDAVAGAALQKLDGLAVLGRRNGLLQRLILGAGVGVLSHVVLGSEADRVVAVVDPLVVLRRFQRDAVVLDHKDLLRLDGIAEIAVDHKSAFHRGLALQSQAGAVLRVVAGGGDLDVAVDGAVLHRDVHGRIAAVAAHVKGEAARRCRDRRALDLDRAVVVGHGVAAPDIGAVDRHVLQSQVTVVLDQEAGILGAGRQSAVLE